jgi:predicted ester cyclase
MLSRPSFAVAASAVAFLAPFPAVAASPEAVVRGFLQDVRSGRRPELADQYLAPTVLAHQVTSEAESIVERTPANYQAHVIEFLTLFGDYRFEVTELLAAGDRVYVRWRQEGRHLASIAGEAPSGQPLVDISSAVYRVHGGRIVEYWIQSDRAGLQMQLECIDQASRP